MECWWWGLLTGWSLADGQCPCTISHFVVHVSEFPKRLLTFLDHLQVFQCLHHHLGYKHLVLLVLLKTGHETPELYNMQIWSTQCCLLHFMFRSWGFWLAAQLLRTETQPFKVWENLWFATLAPSSSNTFLLHPKGRHPSPHLIRYVAFVFQLQSRPGCEAVDHTLHLCSGKLLQHGHALLSLQATQGTS